MSIPRHFIKPWKTCECGEEYRGGNGKCPECVQKAGVEKRKKKQ